MTDSASFRIEAKHVVHFGPTDKRMFEGARPRPNCRYDSNAGLRPDRTRSAATFRSASLAIVISVIAPTNWVAGRISRRASHGMNVFHRAIRHQQSVFMIEILSIAGGLPDGFLHGSAIFRMGPLENKFQGRFHRLVALEDLEGLVRPDDFSARGIPAEAPGAAQSLRFRQIHFAMPQRRFNRPLILDRCLQVIAGTPENFVVFPCAEITNATMRDVMENRIRRGSSEISPVSKSCFQVNELIGGTR